MTTALRIAKARTRLHSAVPIAPERLADWEDEFAHLDGDALAGRWVQPEEWLLIRRLPLRTTWRADEAGIEVGRAWGHALDRAIAEALARGDGTCVRYRHIREAVADMVYRASLRDTSRHWAWQRMGLLPRADVPADDALRHALREIEQQPGLAWPVLAQLLVAEESTAAFTAALRAAGGSLVPRLLKLSPRSAPYLDAGVSAPGRPSATELAGGVGPKPSWPAPAQAMVRWAGRRAALARQHHDTLATLLAALAAPAPGVAVETLWQRVALAHEKLHTATGGAAPPATPRPPVADPTHRLEDTPPVQGSTSTETTRPSGPAPLPELPLADVAGQATHWGGALFWLTRLGDAWQAFEPQPELAWLLHETAHALGVPGDDPALAGFCGGEAPQGEAPPLITAQAQALVARWEAWLLEAAPELPEPRVTHICRRDGRLVMEPGWITLHLPLTSVDTAIRRLALDLDPGWLPWLGCVVRISYDDA